MNLNHRNVTRNLYLATSVLTLVHVAVLVVYYWVDDEEKFDFVRLVDMDYEGNLPTLFSTFLFFLAAFLLYMLAQRAKSEFEQEQLNQSGYAGWIGLSFVFCFLGFDEGAKVHEYVGDFIERFIDAEGVLYFPWVLPYLAALTVLVLVYLPFYFRLAIIVRWKFFFSAALFITGAVFFDMLGGLEADRNGTTSMLYSGLYTIEEVLEMLGLILFCNTLMELLVEKEETLVLC